MQLADRYLDLLSKSVLEESYLENEFRLFYLRQCLKSLDAFDNRVYLDVRLHSSWSQYRAEREVGRFLDDSIENVGFPHTMIGRKRLDHLRWCLEEVRRSSIPGDLMECGVWRGGAALFMRGFLAAYGDFCRKVWLADSFEGPPTPSFQGDEDLSKGSFPELAVPLEIVRDTFTRYGLLDNQVRFLEGWFRDTLPSCGVVELALLRVDGDLYESTRQVLENLYDKVTPGGFVIIDDYRAVELCGVAVDEFRANRGIEDLLEDIDWTAVYWRKSHASTASREFAMVRR